MLEAISEARATETCISDDPSLCSPRLLASLRLRIGEKDILRSLIAYYGGNQ